MKTTAASRKATMYAEITRHGESLLRAFPNATKRDPVALSKALRRIESEVYKPVLDYCNGDNGVEIEEVDAACEKAKTKVRALLGITEERANAIGLFVNRDPRGYALKLSSEWTEAHNRAISCVGPARLRDMRPIHSDWGGYGILAPDFTPRD